MKHLNREMIKRITLNTYLENMGENIKSLTDKSMRFLLQWEEYSEEEREIIQRYIKKVLKSVASL